MQLQQIIKWAGGKADQAADIVARLDLESAPPGSRLLIPFLGAGSVLAKALQNGWAGPCSVGDACIEVHALWTALKAPGAAQGLNAAVCQVLLPYHRCKTKEDRSKYYYEVREAFNACDDAMSFEQVARFMFLNRLGFNGVWRKNGMGKCNLPAGDLPKHFVFPGTIRYIEWAEALTQTDIVFGDFEEIVQLAGPGDRLYLDPPYWPLKKGGFMDYGNVQFRAPDHERLALHAAKASHRGARVIASNHDTPEVRAIWMTHPPLKKQWDFIKVDRSGSMNSDTEKRGAVPELMIVG